MLSQETINPFHEGELKAQALAGAGDVASWAGGFIRDHFPQQHRDFHTSMPFLVAAGAGSDGHTWVTIVDGPEGFITSPDPRHLSLATRLDDTDPLAFGFSNGADIGFVGIELASRRRNRFSGRVHAGKDGYVLEVAQTFGNCPQYIHERSVTHVPKADIVRATDSTALNANQIALIGDADTMFIGSGQYGKSGEASNGYDASHRGGHKGFVNVASPTHLQIPDYAGNNIFNTIGNIISNPRVGLLFVDFETGGLLHIAGRASIDWDPKGAFDPDARRIINIEIDAVLDRPAAVGLRWERQDHLARRLRLTERVEESDTITSFYLESTDTRSLPPFKAGQYLPVEVQIPGQSGAAKRSYSLSGDPDRRNQYRLSIKREDKGLVSRFLHDTLQPGDLLTTKDPSGDFELPDDQSPVVLVSAGVGLTPMVSMLHAATAQDNRPVWFVHGAQNGKNHALKDEVETLVSQNENAHKRIFYSRPDDTDVAGKDYDAAGRVTADDLLDLDAGPDAHYMLCGPAIFLSDIRTGLEAGGVPAAHIHFETFGPTG